MRLPPCWCTTSTPSPRAHCVRGHRPSLVAAGEGVRCLLVRLPFLQLESDIIAHGAAEVANLAGCPVPQALGHIALVRAWAVSHATDEAPPDGWVDGDSADRRIEAAAQWTGERGALVQALLDAGQIRREEGGVRVLHLDPYARAWNQNAKAKERMKAARERSANKRETSHERSAKFDGQTQTQTQKKEETTPLPPKGGEEGRKKPSASMHNVAQPTQREPEPVAYPESPPADVLPHESGPEPHGSQGAAWTLPDAVEAVHLHLTGRRYGYEPARDDKAATELMSLASAEGIAPSDWAGEVARRFGRALIRSTWQYERAAGKAVTLRELARRECWRINAEAPWEDKQVRDGISGVLEHRRVAYDPWDEMLEMRGAA